MSDTLPPIVHRAIDMKLDRPVKPTGSATVCWRFDLENDVQELVAQFAVREDPGLMLQIRFDGLTLVRALDETWLSLETTPGRWQGIDGSFARIVEGSDFMAQQATLCLAYPESRNYQFVTDWACLDVIAIAPPSFALVQR